MIKLKNSMWNLCEAGDGLGGSYKKACIYPPLWPIYAAPRNISKNKNAFD